MLGCTVDPPSVSYTPDHHSQCSVQAFVVTTVGSPTGAPACVRVADGDHSGTAGHEQVNEALAMPGGGVWNVGPGQVTDDSEMALCLLRGLEQGAPPALPEEAIATCYADWYNSGPFDIGAHS